MVIVPKQNNLEVEAFVLNKDVGFVRDGQDAEIKIETFPFTKYGTIHGKVLHVSNDAIQQDARQPAASGEPAAGGGEQKDKPAGLVYAARVQLSKSTMTVDDKIINLTPGMAVTVEVKTGKRRLIEYFLSPLIQYKNESLRER
jgi:hemolysin D